MPAPVRRTDAGPSQDPAWPFWVVHLTVLGLFLTLRGYQSFDNDQAYRLPILLRQLDLRLYADDPFVRSFDAFNPHRGFLAILGGLANSLGIPASLLLLFLASYGMTCAGVDRLARANWPGLGRSVGIVALILVLTAKAGNIGTNHLFEGMVRDRTIAFAAGWLTLGFLVVQPADGMMLAGLLLLPATIIHPSLGLQLGLLVASSGVAWALWPGPDGCGKGLRSKVRLLAGIAIVALSLVPGLYLNLVPWQELARGLTPGDFWTLSVELQSPQHMLPHLWRTPQWLAWGCYLALAFIALARRPGDSPGPWPAGRLRTAWLLGILIVGLAVATFAIEALHHLRIALFQPFRMATLARGLALSLVAGRVVALWRRGSGPDRMRAALLVVGFSGDWLLVVVTIAEVGVSLAEELSGVLRIAPPHRTTIRWACLLSTLLAGACHLARHDTESGHRVILAVVCGVGIVEACRAGGFRTRFAPSRPVFRRAPAFALAAAWTLPVAAMTVCLIPACRATLPNVLVRGLVSRCRFAPIPLDDMEALGDWCRENTPATARFVGPPGPKTFRLWSRRSLAFNRAASPYGAAGLADWFARFQDHVGFRATPAEFARMYLSESSARHRLESKYDGMSEAELAELAIRQGADHVIARTPGRDRPGGAEGSPLVLVHVQGRYAAYRVNPGRRGRPPEVLSGRPAAAPRPGQHGSNPGASLRISRGLPSPWPASSGGTTR